MLPHEERVIKEKEELDIKLHKLNAFIDTNPTFKTLTPKEQLTMLYQARGMRMYSDALQSRIEGFK